MHHHEEPGISITLFEMNISVYYVFDTKHVSQILQKLNGKFKTSKMLQLSVNVTKTIWLH